MDSDKDLIRRHWDRRAPSFDAESPSHCPRTPEQERAWRRLVAELAGPEPLDALDVGCGTGFLSLLLAELGHRVVGVDFAPAMLTEARAKAQKRGLSVRFVEADAESPGLPAASVGLVVERHVLWTLPRPAAALDAWRRALAPNGRLALIEGRWGPRERRDEYDELRERPPLFGGGTAEELAALARASGFRSVESRPLMDPELWDQPPSHPRYVVTARA